MSENLPAQQAKFSLPKLQDLYEQKDIELISKFNDFNKLLNSQPRKEWISHHPTAKKKVRGEGGAMIEVPVEFIPIGIVEYLLTSLFIKWRPEVLREGVMANSVYVAVRLHVLNPITMEWEWYDGIGAVPIRVNKGAAATDFTQVQSSAIQTGLPAAKSYAISDAADCIGKIFGKDMNRNAEMDYQPMQEAKTNALGPVPEELVIVIDAIETGEDYDKIWGNNPIYHANRDFLTRMKAKRAEIMEKEAAND